MKRWIWVALVPVPFGCTGSAVDSGVNRDDGPPESVRSTTTPRGSQGFTPDWSRYERWIVRYELDQVVVEPQPAVIRHVPCDWIYVTQKKTPTYVTVEGRSVRPDERAVDLRHFTRSGQRIFDRDPESASPPRLEPRFDLAGGGWDQSVSYWPAFPLEPGVTVWPDPDGVLTQIVIDNFTEYLITTTRHGTTREGRELVDFMVMTWQKDKPFWSTVFTTSWAVGDFSPQDGEVPFYEKGEVLHWGDGAPPGFYDLPQFPPHIELPPWVTRRTGDSAAPGTAASREGDDDGR